MRMRSECVPCLLRRVIYEADLVEGNKEKALKEALRILAQEYSWNANSILVATKVHRLVYKLLGTQDPYKEMKLRSNDTALKLLPKVEELVACSENRLEAAVLCSIIGNQLDFGIGSYSAPEDLTRDFNSFYNEGLEVNDLSQASKYLQPGKEILLLADNCGEIIFDKILCRELKKFGTKIALVVKDKPMLNDATIEDVKKLKLDEVVDEVLLSTNAVGIDFNEISAKLKNKIAGADLIICKGMGLYEAFCETNYKPILYLLRTKCAPVAQDMGVSKGINVAKLYD